MLSSVLSKAALAVVPAAGGPVAAVLVPALAAVISSRQFEIDLRIVVR
ncbi:hypothetical protein GO615_21430 [Aromatoleum evansii]|nr:hypothetical protein [Aromatoleum evansii]